jgi:hypothetical protein
MELVPKISSLIELLKERRDNAVARSGMDGGNETWFIFSARHEAVLDGAESAGANASNIATIRTAYAALKESGSPMRDDKSIVTNSYNAAIKAWTAISIEFAPPTCNAQSTAP